VRQHHLYPHIDNSVLKSSALAESAQETAHKRKAQGDKRKAYLGFLSEVRSFYKTNSRAAVSRQFKLSKEKTELALADILLYREELDALESETRSP
jgi:hypothetical protein